MSFLRPSREERRKYGKLCRVQDRKQDLINVALLAHCLQTGRDQGRTLSSATPARLNWGGCGGRTIRMAQAWTSWAGQDPNPRWFLQARSQWSMELVACSACSMTRAAACDCRQGGGRIRREQAYGYGAGVAETGPSSASPHSLIDLNPTFSPAAKQPPAGAMHAVSPWAYALANAPGEFDARFGCRSLSSRSNASRTQARGIASSNLSSAARHRPLALAAVRVTLAHVCLGHKRHASNNSGRRLSAHLPGEPDQHNRPPVVGLRPSTKCDDKLTDHPSPAAIPARRERGKKQKPHCYRCTAWTTHCTHRKWPEMPLPAPYSWRAHILLVGVAEWALDRGVRRRRRFCVACWISSRRRASQPVLARFPI